MTVLIGYGILIGGKYDHERTYRKFAAQRDLLCRSAWRPDTCGGGRASGGKRGCAQYGADRPCRPARPPCIRAHGDSAREPFHPLRGPPPREFFEPSDERRRTG